MANTEKRVVIDTNWYISFLIKKGDNRLHTILFNYDIEIIISDELLRELRSTIGNDRFRKYFSVEDAILLIELLQQRAKNVTIITPLKEWCRDTKDNYLLALSKDSNAHYLITGDKDLLSLQQFENTQIVTLSKFLEIINESS